MDKLPANAKGVLYQSGEQHYWAQLPTGDIFIGNTLPPEVTPEFFKITDATNGTVLPARVVHLNTDVLHPLSASRRLFRNRSSKLARCTFQTRVNQLCRELEHLRKTDTQEWIAKLIEHGELEDVTKEAKRRLGIFRIEPAGGFVPGHAYTFFAGNNSKDLPPSAKTPAIGIMQVSISEEPPPVITNDSLSLTFVDGVQPSALAVPQSDGRCSETVTVKAQKIFYNLAPELEPYRDSLSILTMYAEADDPAFHDSSAVYRHWRYRRSLCDTFRFGKIFDSQRKDMLYSRCKGKHFSDLRRGVDYSIKAYFGLLEVHDSFFETNIETARFPEEDPEQCSEAAIRKMSPAKGRQ